MNGDHFDIDLSEFKHHLPPKGSSSNLTSLKNQIRLIDLALSYGPKDYLTCQVLNHQTLNITGFCSFQNGRLRISLCGSNVDRQYEVELEVNGMGIVGITNIHIETPLNYSIQVVEEGIRVCFEKHSKIAFDLCLAQKMSNGSLNYCQSYHVPSGTSVMILQMNDQKVVGSFILRLCHHDNGLFSKKVDLNTPYIHSKQFIIQ
ncbi:hypothetical protein QTN25_005226 [Entamoeba marina]